MDTSLSRLAVIVALFSGLAGQLLAVSPRDRNVFEATNLARASLGEGPAPMITALQLADPDGYSVSPLRGAPSLKHANKPVVNIPPTIQGMAAVLKANGRLGEPIVDRN